MYEVVVEAMGKVGSLYDVTWKYWVQSHDAGAGKYSEGKADLFRTDPPYNVRTNQNRYFPEYHSFMKPDMEDMVFMVQDVLTNGGHRHVFLSKLQLGDW